MPPDKVAAQIAEGRMHLRFVIKLYDLQLSEGRHYLHEHPAQATSWSDQHMLRLLRHPKSRVVTSDQCEYGLVTPNADGVPTPAKKPTSWATSSAQMAARLSKWCGGGHAHQPLLSGRAKHAAFYPLPLVTEILRGMRDTADAEENPDDHEDLVTKEMSLAMSRAGNFSDLVPCVASVASSEKQYLTEMKMHDGTSHKINMSEHFREAYKDVYTNELLPSSWVRDAIYAEPHYFNQRVWTAVPESVAKSDP